MYMDVTMNMHVYMYYICMYAAAHNNVHVYT